MFTGNLFIFGAKSTAIGMIRAIRYIYHECIIQAVLVSSIADNPSEIEGLAVYSLSDFSRNYSQIEKDNCKILVATPVYVQGEIRDTLKNFGFTNLIMLDSVLEERIMGEYYTKNGLFPSLESSDNKHDFSKICMLKVGHSRYQFAKDKLSQKEWTKSFGAGRGWDDSDERLGIILDNSGVNISDRNELYCELTALYWAWKNLEKSNYKYIGVEQYRRSLDIEDRQMSWIIDEDIDVVVPYPMIHLPNIREHHTRYIGEEEWNALLQAIGELAPEYQSDFDRIFDSQYMYNYNMLLTKREVFTDYCAWLFPILERTEKICKEKSICPAKRYIVYLGESMLTLYFIHNAYRYKIRHTGRILRNE